jgi:ribose transport system ATP-binding protein
VPPFLELTGISKSFGGTHALKGVDIAFERGRVHAIVGENGAGKSTLIKTIMGVHQPDTGEILLNGQPTSVTNPAVARGLGFSAVYQEPLTYPYLNVLENIFMNKPVLTRFGNIDERAMEQQVKPFFDQLELDTSILHREIRTLRFGHQQLVMIAKALIEDAQLIIFDEPTSILSGTETDHLFKIINLLKESDKSIIYISHRLEELMRIADEATVLTDGRVIGHRDGNIDTDELLSMMAGRDVRDFEIETRLSAPKADTEPVLEIRNLSKQGIFEDVSLQLWPGEVLGIYGQVGAGRSEVALTVFGRDKADNGEIYMNGKPVTIQNPWNAIRLGVGYLPEDRKFQGVFSFQPISNNLISVVLRKLKGPLWSVSAKKVRALVEKYQKVLNIKYGSSSDPISSLSGGNQQKVMFGRLMAEDLKVLVLDEPTQGIDVMTKRDIHQLIRTLADEGLAVIVISSDLTEILAVSSRILVMNRGKIVSEYVSFDENMAESLLRDAIRVREVVEA